MRAFDRIPQRPAFAVLCGVLMTLPTLGAGLFMDDALTRAKLLGVDTPWSPAPWWDLYTFARADLNPGLLAAGHHPWWADPDVRMTFFRPLSAASHWLDYRLWPSSPALQHLHSVLWYGGCVAVAGALLRRLQGHGRAAAIGAVAFAVATPHAMTVGWLAGRNTLICFVLGGLMLAAHVRGQRTGARRLKLAAPALLIVGLLAGEATLAALAYVVAWHLCLDDRPWPTRLAALAPLLLIVVGWRVLYVQAGFGATATGIYHDPSTDLLDFARAQLTHLPVLLLGRWLPAPLDFWSIAPPGARLLAVGVGQGIGLGLAGLFRRALRSDARTRFWALGMVGALLPFCATVPMDRLTLFSGLGFAGLIGQLAERRPARASARWLRTLILALHLPVAAALGLARGGTLALNFAPNTTGYAQAPRDAAVPEQTFVYVTGTFHRTHYTTLMRAAAGEAAVPRRAVVLSSLATDSTITRTGPDRLEVVPTGGFMASS